MAILAALMFANHGIQVFIYVESLFILHREESPYGSGIQVNHTQLTRQKLLADIRTWKLFPSSTSLMAD